MSFKIELVRFFFFIFDLYSAEVTVMVNAAVNEKPKAILTAGNIFKSDHGLIYFLSPSKTQELVLDASLSSDPNEQDVLSYHFTCVSGPDGVNLKAVVIS